MSIDRWTDEDAVIRTYNTVLLGLKKECIWVCSDEVDEPRVCYTEWSQSERQKQVSYTNANTWNLERLYWWSYLQGSNGNPDREETYGHGRGQEGEGGMYGESNMDTYVTTCTTHSQWGCAGWLREHRRALYQPRGVRWGGMWQGGSVGRRHMYTCGWFMLGFGRNQHNFIKQLTFN